MAGEAPAKGMLKAPFAERLPRLRALFGFLRLSERGTALVEFALIAPVLFALVIGVLDFGQGLNYYNQLTQLAGQGARAAAVNTCIDGSTMTAGSTCIQDRLNDTYAHGPLRNNTTVHICWPNGAGIGKPVTVKTQYTFNWISLIVIQLPPITLKACQTERQEAKGTYSAVTGGTSCNC